MSMGLGLWGLSLAGQPQGRASAAAYPSNIGGLDVGSAGTGYLANYRLAWGEEFTKLDIVGPTKPRGKWFTVKTYSPGSRGGDTALDTSYDTDLLMTGYLDSNKGVAVGYDNMSVANSVVSLQARKATTGELTNFPPDGRTNLACLLFGPGVGHWYCDAQTTGDIVFEARIRFTNGAPLGWHPTMWTLSLNPVIEYDSDECDFEGNSTGGFLKRNFWNAGTHTSSAGSAGVVSIYDGNWHKVALVMNTTFLRLYIDDTSTDTINSSANAKSKPAYPIFSSHIFDGVYESEDYDQTEWDSKPDGGTIDIDWMRVWTRAGMTHYEPLVTFADQNVNYGESTVIQLPDASDIWGADPTGEYLQVVPTEENSPGVTHSALFTQFPSGVSYDSGTRQITVNVTSGNSGAMDFVLSAWEVGGTGRPLRFRVNLSPNITQADIAVNPGDSVDEDIYAACDVGILSPKTIAMSGLTGSGLSYDSGTGHLTGTAVEGDYSMVISCTNRLGQTTEKTVAISVTAQSFVFTDSFDRANQNLSADGNWTRIDGSSGMATIVSNHLSCQTTDASGAAYTCPDIGQDGMYVQAKWNFTTGTPAAFFGGRISDRSNWIGVRYNGSTNHVQLYKAAAGTLTKLGSNSASAITAGDTIRLEINSTAKTARVLVNGSEVISAQDITGVQEGVTKAGVIARSTFMTNWLDDFEAGAL